MNVTVSHETHGLSTKALTIQLIFFALSSDIAILGNIILILTVYKRPSLHRVTYYVVSALAIEDLLASITYVLGYPHALILGEWALGNTACELYAFLMIFFGSCELFLMAAISLDRYVACCRPLHYSRLVTSRRCAVVIAFCWLFSVLLSLVTILGCESFGYSSYLLICQVDFLSGEKSVYCSAVLLAVTYMPSSMIIGICQCKILKQVRRVIHNAPPNVTSGTSGATSGSSSIKATMTVSLITGTYLICWLPFLSVRSSGLFVNWEQSDSYRQTLATLRIATFHIFIISKFTNPLIYGIYNLEFRRECKTLFRITRTVS